MLYTVIALVLLSIKSGLLDITSKINFKRNY